MSKIDDGEFFPVNAEALASMVRDAGTERGLHGTALHHLASILTERVGLDLEVEEARRAAVERFLDLLQRCFDAVRHGRASMLADLADANADGWATLSTTIAGSRPWLLPITRRLLPTLGASLRRELTERRPFDPAARAQAWSILGTLGVNYSIADLQLGDLPSMWAAAPWQMVLVMHDVADLDIDARLSALADLGSDPTADVAADLLVDAFLLLLANAGDQRETFSSRPRVARFLEATGAVHGDRIREALASRMPGLVPDFGEADHHNVHFTSITTFARRALDR